ncbi:flagellin [Gammaproteobacteria bacterium]|nr:flagellin [Gammaproteobacteria bacterium]
MSVINTNIAGKIATNAIIRNDRMQEIAMERLSTGLRINSAKDDAAGLAISQRMRAEVSGLEMATRNANDAISMLETVEGASLEIANILQRMRELAVQSASGTYSNTDRSALDLEFGELFLEMQRIATQTTWNTMSLMDGDGQTDNTVAATTVNIQLGKSTAQTMALTLKSFDPRTALKATTIMQTLTPVRAYAEGAQVAAVVASGYDRLGNLNHTGNTAAGETASEEETQAFGAAVLFAGNAAAADTRIDILTENNAGFALTNLDKAITGVSAERAKYGAYISRLQHAGDNLLNVAQNQDQSRSRIEDADYAIETSELARTQIIAQASTAMLAQANQAKQTVLTLLK